MPTAAQAIYPNGPNTSLGNITTVPMPDSVFKGLEGIGDNAAEDYPAAQQYEDIVDKHIKDQKLSPGDRFKVDHPEGPRFYEVLKPNSGGRKDWRQIKQQPPEAVS